MTVCIHFKVWKRKGMPKRFLFLFCVSVAWCCLLRFLYFLVLLIYPKSASSAYERLRLRLSTLSCMQGYTYVHIFTSMFTSLLVYAVSPHVCACLSVWTLRSTQGSCRPALCILVTYICCFRVLVIQQSFCVLII